MGEIKGSERWIVRGSQFTVKVSAAREKDTKKRTKERENNKMAEAPILYIFTTCKNNKRREEKNEALCPSRNSYFLSSPFSSFFEIRLDKRSTILPFHNFFFSFSLFHFFCPIYCPILFLFKFYVHFMSRYTWLLILLLYTYI